MVNKDNAGTFGVGLLIGSVVGVVIGILFAPQSGKETREMIADKAHTATAKAEEIINEAKAKAAHIIDEAKKKVSHSRKDEAQA